MKRPAFQWYPGDWQRDLALQACSFEARSLWREMLDRMHDGDPYGHLTAGGMAIAPADLARMIGKPAPIVKKWIDELESRKVFSRDDEGVIYSRRMVRDERVRNARAAGGSKSLENDNVPRPKQPPKDDSKDPDKDTLPPSLGGSPTTTTSVSSSTSVQQLVADARIRFSVAANRGLDEHPTAPQKIPPISPNSGRTLEETEKIIGAGVPIEFAEARIYELARAHTAERKIVSLKYFTEAVVRSWDEHQTVVVTSNGKTRPPPPRVANGRGSPRLPPQVFDYPPPTEGPVKWQTRSKQNPPTP